MPTTPDGISDPMRLLGAEDFRFGGARAPSGIFGNLAIVGLEPVLQAAEAEGRLVVAVDIATHAIA